MISAAVLALGLASCSKEAATPAPEQPTDRQITIIARTEGSAGTRTSLSGDDASGYQVLWSEGDVITLADGWNSEFTLSEGAGTTTGAFVGTSQEGDGTFQVFYATDGKWLFGRSEYKDLNMLNSTPMAASVTIQDGEASLTDFKNLCGFLRLTLKGTGSVSEIRVHAEKPLNGRFDIDKTDGHAIVEESDLDSKYVNTLECGDGVEISADGKDFYISMPQGDYEGIRIEIADYIGRTCTKTLKAGNTLNITRSKITPVTLNVTGLEGNPLPPGALPGAFTVNSKGKRVFFSRGNLYWDGDSFELEEEQYNYPNERVDNHIGHFCWNISASESLKEGVYDEKFILFTNNPDYADRANADFVVNGVRGRYRTLTIDEWGYLLHNHQYSHAAAEGVNGLVIAPDGVTLEDDKKSYTNEELKNDNLVFLPAAGYYSYYFYGRKELIGCGGEAYYLSCNPYTGGNASAIVFNNNNLWDNYGPSVHMGNCIRLVTAMSNEEPLDSPDIEKPEDGNDYDWE